MNQSLSSEIRLAELLGRSCTVKNGIALEVHRPIFFFSERVLKIIFTNDYFNLIATNWHNICFQLVFCLCHTCLHTDAAIMRPTFSSPDQQRFYGMLAEPTLQLRSPEKQCFPKRKCCFLLDNWKLDVLLISVWEIFWMAAEAGLELSKVDKFTNAVQKKETNSFQFAVFSKASNALGSVSKQKKG